MAYPINPLLTAYLEEIQHVPTDDDIDEYSPEPTDDLEFIEPEKRGGDMWKFRSGKRAGNWKFRGGKRENLWKFRGGKRADLWKFRGGKRADLWKFRGGKRADLWKFRGGKRMDYGKYLKYLTAY